MDDFFSKKLSCFLQNYINIRITKVKLTLAEEIRPSATTFTMLVVENSAMTIINKRNPFELTMSV